MTVGKIALGVFLGNLAFALLAWVVVSIRMEELQAQWGAAEAHARLEALQRQAGQVPPSNAP